MGATFISDADSPAVRMPVIHQNTLCISCPHMIQMCCVFFYSDVIMLSFNTKLHYKNINERKQ